MGKSTLIKSLIYKFMNTKFANKIINILSPICLKVDLKK